MFEAVETTTEAGNPRRIKGGGLPAEVAAPAPRKARTPKLDGESAQRTHALLLSLYTHELDRQAENRQQMADDEAFYDGIQWREEDAQQLRDRGQYPLVFNVISSTIDWITGTERRARTDFNVLPRRKPEAKAAQKKTNLMKYLSDVNKEPFHVSRAFEDQVKVGIGWMEDGAQDTSEEEQLFSRYESWRNVLWDSAGIDMDLGDSRYLFRGRWLDLDITKAMFADRTALLERSADVMQDVMALDQFGDQQMDERELWASTSLSSRRSDEITGWQRKRVRVIEAWLKMPVTASVMQGGTWSGELYDPYSPAHREDLEAENAVLVKKVRMRMHVAIFTAAGMLWLSESPYRHNKFPLTPFWGHRYGKTGLPYGVVRRLRDIQDDINKRASKALHILNSNKVIMDEGALPDDMTLEEFADEVGRPDAILQKKKGYELDINADREVGQWHLEQMSREMAFIQSASGVTDENMGRKSNATSGVAIARRQEQGALTTAKFFDNQQFAQQCRGEKILVNIEQFMTEPKQFRITNQRGQADYHDVNDGLPENDIVRSKADFIISEADWQATIRQAAAEQMLETLSRFPPQVALVLLDLVVDNMDLPNREEIVKRIRGLNGQRDPDAEEPTPEEMAQQQAAAQAQALQQKGMEAEIELKIAQAAKTKAEAAAAERKGVTDGITAVSGALDAALKALTAPEVAAVSDHILSEVGFVAAPEREAQAANLAQQIGLGAPLAVPGAGSAPAEGPMPAQQNPTPEQVAPPPEGPAAAPMI